MKIIAFWAQPLDNVGPDTIKSQNSYLHIDDAESRQGTVSMISNVMTDGKTLFSTEGVKLFTHNRLSVVEISPEERDEHDRISPIILCLERDYVEFDSNEITNFLNQLDDFLFEAKRTVSKARREDIRSAIMLLSETKNDCRPSLPVPFLKKSWKIFLFPVLFIIMPLLKAFMRR